LAAVVGHLGLPVEMAQTLGAEPDLLRVVQLAVGLVQRQGKGLYLAVGASPPEAAAALGLPAAVGVDVLAESQGLQPLPWEPREWSAPERVPLLHDLLVVALENRRLRDAPAGEQLERELDQLYLRFQEQRGGEAERLQSLKLAALAEFAAGAGHEINNPLAVISGQAQYLLGHEAEPAKQRALQTVIGQTQRIHQILNELMQFARPPRPQKQAVDVPDLIREVAGSLSELAGERRVQLVCPLPERPVGALYADPRQVRTALECLLRNAIEAAPADGWAGVRLELSSPDRLELIVEDNGSGPPPAQRDHLFDPFYSGRHAGRGRGLGLPTAWRLAREHGGDVRFDSLANGTTRFVLSLPREVNGNGTSANGSAQHGDRPAAAG
jgi:signal transduction histidine kinase